MATVPSVAVPLMWRSFHALLPDAPKSLSSEFGIKSDATLEVNVTVLALVAPSVTSPFATSASVPSVPG